MRRQPTWYSLLCACSFSRAHSRGFWALEAEQVCVQFLHLPCATYMTSSEVQLIQFMVTHILGWWRITSGTSFKILNPLQTSVPEIPVSPVHLKSSSQVPAHFFLSPEAAWLAILPFHCVAWCLSHLCFLAHPPMVSLTYVIPPPFFFLHPSVVLSNGYASLL